MELLCHRCGTTLTGDDTFCPTCGAPQLRIEDGADGVEAFNAARPRPPGREPLDASWKDAIWAALIFAVPVGVLTSQALPFASGGFMWVVAGAIAAVNLYHRRAAGSLLNVRVGVRIGMVLGLLAAVLSGTLNGIVMVVQRYFLRDGAADKAVQFLVDSVLAANARSGQTEAQFHQVFGTLSTPEARAALMLFATFWSSFLIFAFSIIGGAIGAKIFSMRGIGVKNS